jgi:hypothetical protein
VTRLRTCCCLLGLTRPHSNGSVVNKSTYDDAGLIFLLASCELGCMPAVRLNHLVARGSKLAMLESRLVGMVHDALHVFVGDVV